MDWFRGERLGCGSFAQVNLAIPRSRSSFLPSVMAVKSCGASLSASLVNEKLILEDLRDCPQIIGCYGGNYSCENGENLYNVLLEYASGGSLADKLKNSDDRRLPEIQARQYTKAMLKGLNYIHKFGYVHCDIKLQNVLITADGGVKIADFGLTKKADVAAASACELRGTPMYMSPEMVTGSEQGAPADMWALGCLVAEMVSGSPVWSCTDVAALLMKIGVGEEVPEIPGFLSAEGKDFLEKCFVKDPKKRWTAEMLLDHPFVCGEEIEEKENSASTSPRCPFDFEDWSSSPSPSLCSITSVPSPSEFKLGGWSVSTASERICELVNFTESSSDWSAADDWVTIR